MSLAYACSGGNTVAEIFPLLSCAASFGGLLQTLQYIFILEDVTGTLSQNIGSKLPE
jgi:hypothetical protein